MLTRMHGVVRRYESTTSVAGQSMTETRPIGALLTFVYGSPRHLGMRMGMEVGRTKQKNGAGWG
jgi:hypothetical protein